MSISIASGVDVPLSLPGFFAADAEEPITFCGFVKFSDTSPGFEGKDLIKAESAGGDGYRLYPYSSADGFAVRQRIYSSGVDDNNVVTLSAAEVNQWVPIVAVYSAIDSRTLYVKQANATIATSTDTDTRSTSGDILNLVLMDQAYFAGEVKAAHLAIYQSALTQTQAEEFMNTGAVAALTPLAKWDATTDWGAGTIADSGSSGTDLTPPASWTFSADNPAVGAVVPEIRKSSTFDIETTLSGTVTAATLNGNAITVDSQTGTTVTLTDSGSGITTSGEYDLVLTDDSADPDETITVQVNVVGLPSFNCNKDGADMASLTDLELEAFNASGTHVKQLTALTTDASGDTGVIDLSDLSEDVGDTLKVSLYSPSASAGLTFEQALELI